MAQHIVILTTVASEEEGLRIARDLVERRLAACVNVTAPVRSVYRWKGAVEEATERLVWIKTLDENRPRVEEAIARLHSYEIPELIALPIEGGEVTYLNWLTAQASPLRDES